MELYFKTTAGFLLLAQAFCLASFQHSTDSPGRTINKSWLRELVKNKTGSQAAALPGGNTEFNQGADVALESTRDYSSGIASGSIATLPEPEENVTGQDKNAKEGSDDLNSVTATQPPVDLNATTKQPHSPEANVSASPTMDSSNTSQINTTDAEEELFNSTATQNSSTHLAAQNSTSFLDLDSNHTDSQTTLAPEGNDTQESTIKPDEDTWLPNTTESTDLTNETSSTSLSTTFRSTTTDISSETTITPLQNTPELVNKTGKGSATGSDSDRAKGLESDSHRSGKNRAWGAIIGTAVAVTCVAVAAYLILKNKQRKGFSHRKLVEEYPSDPVLRLDNSEPLDLNFGQVAYYNPELQGDSIQMANIPSRY